MIRISLIIAVLLMILTLSSLELFYLFIKSVGGVA